MSRIAITFAVVVAVFTGGLGYWLGQENVGRTVNQEMNASSGKGRILFYRNPMGALDTSPMPKKDPMGMDYIPVYENEQAETPGTVKIGPAKTQRAGVRTEVATRRKIAPQIHAVGAVKLNEARVAVVAPRVEGWIEQVHAGATGLSVTAGQPLVEIYSPEFVQAQEEYILARNAKNALADSALKRLQNLGFSADQIRQLVAAGRGQRNLTLRAPISGVILEKSTVLGQRFMPGDQLYRIADTSAVWVVAKIPEQDVTSIRLGGTVSISVRALPDKVVGGLVGFIAPEVNLETRTVDVRIDVPNLDGKLRADMYAMVSFSADRDVLEKVSVPDSAIIDSGAQQVALISKASGQFEPRQVIVGNRANGYVAILSGVNEGETVVVNATFLIDAESNLKAALQSFTDAPTAKERAP